MTYRKLLMALSIATMFIVATSYPHIGASYTAAPTVLLRQEVVDDIRIALMTFTFYHAALLPSSSSIAAFRRVPLHFTCGAAQELI